jgi:hypothetical protein
MPLARCKQQHALWRRVLCKAASTDDPYCYWQYKANLRGVQQLQLTIDVKHQLSDGSVSTPVGVWDQQSGGQLLLCSSSVPVGAPAR